MPFTFVSASSPDIDELYIFHTRDMSDVSLSVYAANHCDPDHDLLVVEIEKCPDCATPKLESMDFGCGLGCDNGYFIVDKIQARVDATKTMIDSLLALTAQREMFTADEIRDALLDIRQTL